MPVPDGGPQTSELLAIGQVARMLRCSADHVRRIPKSHLPAYRPGKENLYFLDDVLAYVRSHCRVGSVPIDQLRENWIDALADEIRGKHRPSRSHNR